MNTYCSVLRESSTSSWDPIHTQTHLHEKVNTFEMANTYHDESFSSEQEFTGLGSSESRNTFSHQLQRPHTHPSVVWVGDSWGRLTAIAYGRPGFRSVLHLYRGEIRTTIIRSRGLGCSVSLPRLSKTYAASQSQWI